MYVMRISLAIAAALVVLALAACGSDSPGADPDATGSAAPEETRQVSQSVSDADPPDLVPEYPGGASGFTRYVFEEIGGEVVTTLVEGPASEQVRYPISYLDLKEAL